MPNLAQRVTQNGVAKLTSLALASVLWVLATGAGQPAEAVPRSLPDQSPPGQERSVQTESAISKEVGLEAFTTGTPEAGFVVGTLTVRPAVVQLSGPVSVLRLVQSLRTAPVDVTGLDSSVSIPTVILIPPKTQLVTPSINTAAVDVHILKRQSEGTIEALDAAVSR